LCHGINENNERQHCHCLSFGCHVAVGDVAPALCVSKGMVVGEGLCWLTNGGPLSPLVHGGVVVVLGVISLVLSFAPLSSWVAVALLLLSCPSSSGVHSMMMNNDISHCLLFGCHVAISDVAPGFQVNREMERGGCVGLTWRKTPMDGDNIVHCHHHPALSLLLLHRVDVVDTGFLAVVGDVVFPCHSDGVGAWQGSMKVVGGCGQW